MRRLRRSGAFGVLLQTVHWGYHYWGLQPAGENLSHNILKYGFIIFVFAMRFLQLDQGAVT